MNTLIENTQGTGKTLVLLYEHDARFNPLVPELFQTLTKNFKVVLTGVPQFSETDWESPAIKLSETIIEAKLRNFCLLCLGSVSSLAMHFYLSNPKLVRSIIFVDALTRPHPTKMTKLIDWLENLLPMGLPFRSFGKVFNGRPFLQRMRCPCLVLTTTQSDLDRQTEAQTMQANLPSAWSATIDFNNFISEISALALDFQDVAAKRPQKNL